MAKLGINTAGDLRADGEVALECITFRYGRHTVLRGTTLTVNSGNVLCLMGPSGCGKTTLLRIVAGLLRPTAGRVCIGGKDVTDKPPQHRNIGLVFQTVDALFPHLTVEQNVAFSFRRGHRRSTTGDWRKDVNQILERTRLSAWRDASLAALSGGMRQRVAIARALVYRPSVLLLDEPLTFLDNDLKYEILTMLQELHRDHQTTILYVTHDDREASAFATDLAIMRDGTIIQTGRTGDVLARPCDDSVALLLGKWERPPVSETPPKATVTVEGDASLERTKREPKPCVITDPTCTPQS